MHVFQQWAYEGIVLGHDVLVCAPTGSGKSLPAELAIQNHYSRDASSGSIVYCSPIKSLSNQKFAQFATQVDHVGLLTGDIKHNPDAPLLVMTTELLLSRLQQQQQPMLPRCVIFDEIHYINDSDRGHVWEQVLGLLPSTTQILGLSATLHNPRSFADWIARIRPGNTVYLCVKTIRPVPLLHYTCVLTSTAVFKKIKDKSVQQRIQQNANVFQLLQSDTGVFQDSVCDQSQWMRTQLQKHYIEVSPIHCLNQVFRMLTEQQWTPAICYVFSIAQLEAWVDTITVPLLPFDSKIPYTIRRECDALLRRAMRARYRDEGVEAAVQEYIQMPEYQRLVRGLEKGIATHHSKMLPLFRELVEVLFSRGTLPLLFATESVAVGLNLPVKTCVFTDVYKHDGHGRRLLLPSEYSQGAGRAGRLGLDVRGHVIHVPQLHRGGNSPSSLEWKHMMKGTPPAIHSQWKFSLAWLLRPLPCADWHTQLCVQAERTLWTYQHPDDPVADILQQHMDYLVRHKLVRYCCGSATWMLTERGTCAQLFHELHGIVWSKRLLEQETEKEEEEKEEKTVEEWIVVLSSTMETHDTVEEEDDPGIRLTCRNGYQTTYSELLLAWCAASTEAECKQVWELVREQGCTLGEFVKVLLKLTALAQEVETVCVTLAIRPDVQCYMQQVPHRLLKHVATNQSLYL
jgi:superfamily II RNA helicase